MKAIEWINELEGRGFNNPVIKLNKGDGRFFVRFESDPDLKKFLRFCLSEGEMVCYDDITINAMLFALESKIGSAPLLDFIEVYMGPPGDIDFDQGMSDQILFNGLWVDDPEQSPYPELTELVLLIWDLIENYRSILCLEMTIDIRSEWEKLPPGQLPEGVTK